MRQKIAPKVKAKKRTKEKRERKPKEKSEVYVMRKNAGLKIARCCLWGILIFFFARGIIWTLQPDDSAEVTKVIQNFEASFASYKGENEEMMGFAQNFAKEYLTYQVKGENDYQNRISPYVSTRIRNEAAITDFSGNAEATYVQAYKKEQYSQNQWDVYVLAEVDYEIRGEKGIEEEGISVSGNSQQNPAAESKILTAQTTLKIPIFAENGNYVVEDIPVFVTDSLLLSKYASSDYTGTPVSDAELSGIKSSINNFFKAYYEEDQSVIEYYLSTNADRNKFYGLYGRYTFASLESLSAYQEEGSSKAVCIVKLKVKDAVNEAVLYQGFNVSVMKEGGKYYIDDMNTRSANAGTVN